MGTEGFVIEKTNGYFIKPAPESDSAEAVADQRYREHAFATAIRVMTEVSADIQHQFDKWGAQYVNGLGWIAIITEEFGETVQGYLKENRAEAIREAKQTIACLLRLIVEIEREAEGLDKLQEGRYVRPQRENTSGPHSTRRYSLPPESGQKRKNSLSNSLTSSAPR
jgi:hypothetical protein